MARRTHQSVPLKYKLDKFTRSFFPDKVRAMHTIRETWRRLYSGGIAEHSWPSHIGYQSLVVHVDDPMWISELQLLKDEMREKLSAQLQRQGLQTRFNAIRFQNGELHWPDPAPVQERASFRIDPAVLKTIDERIKNVQDKDLKQALRHYLITSAMQPEKTQEDDNV